MVCQQDILKMRFKGDIKKNFIPEREVRHWNWLPMEMVSLSLEVLWGHLDVALKTLFGGGCVVFGNSWFHFVSIRCCNSKTEQRKERRGSSEKTPLARFLILFTGKHLIYSSLSTGGGNVQEVFLALMHVWMRIFHIPFELHQKISDFQATEG